MSKGFVEEGRRTARGQPPAHIEWNALDLGGGSFAMERPSSVDHSKRLNQEDIPYTHAYVRKQNKVFCHLCTMWFDKKSVGYKVPSHRIVDLQKKWNCHRAGRRYNNASYLYSFVPVCLFCSQFFQSTDDAVNDQNADSDEFFSITSAAKSNTVEISRRDIAEGQKAYQCSVVDEKGPALVVTPPYDQGGCRSRREVDPWWEVDLGRTQSVHSVSFSATGTLQQKVHIFVILLRGPVGFENPFIDEILKGACDWQEFVFEDCAEIKEESREWTLPGKMFGGAVRIQIRGKHVLRLSRCQVFQGDDLPPDQPQIDFSDPAAGLQAEPMGLDEMMRLTTFASQPIKIFDDIRKECLSKEGATGHILDAKEKQTQTIKRVNILNAQYQARKAKIEWWVDRARDSANFFTIDELMCFRDIVFVPISASSKYTGGKRGNKYVIPTHDLRGNSLTQHYPRCDFGDLIKQLKQISDWIQNRQHSRDINAFLVAPDKFRTLFESESDLFDRLEKVFVFMEETWSGLSRQWGGGRPRPESPGMVTAGRGKRATLLGQQTGRVTSSYDAGIEPLVVDGASWSQVIMTLHLICLNDIENIPEYVFAVDEGLEMLFPLDHDDSDEEGSDDASEDSLLSAIRSERRAARNKESRIKSPGSPIMRRVLTPPPPDISISKASGRDGRSDNRAGSPGSTRPGGLSSGAMRGQFSSPPMTPSNFPGTAPCSLCPINETPAGKAGGRRQASTLPLGMSQLFQLSLLNVKEQPRNSSTHRSDSSERASLLNTQKSKSTANIMNTPKGVNSLLESTKDPRMPNLNFEHAQYKLKRLQKNAKFDRTFPKTLDKNFPIESSLARFQLASRDKKRSTKQDQNSIITAFNATADENVNSDRDSQRPGITREASIGWDVDLFGQSMSESDSPSHSFDDRDTQGGDSFFMPSAGRNSRAESKKKNTPVLKYTRACMLCTQSFPKKGVDNKVMMKHIITIRTALDPALGEKFAGHLLQGLSPFNLVSVCDFCLQFFNPDMPDGVSIPELQRECEIGSSITFGHNATKAIKTFYDDRYPGSLRSEEQASSEEAEKFRENMSRTRARAKNAIEVARFISEAGTAEEERRLMREQMEAQIKAGFGGASLRRGSMMMSPKR